MYIFNSDLFCIPEIFKINVPNQFLVQNQLLNLCSFVVNSQRLYCTQKAGVKCSIKAFWYTYKYLFYVNSSYDILLDSKLFYKQAKDIFSSLN